MKLAFAVSLFCSSFVLADLDQQPVCREGCEQAYAAELAACQREPSQRQIDACREAAADRHQECIDGCND
jgi:hypothetical protein